MLNATEQEAIPIQHGFAATPQRPLRKSVGIQIIVEQSQNNNRPQPSPNVLVVYDPTEIGVCYYLYKIRAISYIQKLFRNQFRWQVPIFIPASVRYMVVFDGKLAVATVTNLIQIYDIDTQVLLFPELALSSDICFVGAIKNKFLTTITQTEILIWNSKMVTIFSHKYPFTKKISKIEGTAELPNFTFSPVIHFTDKEIVRFSISRNQWVFVHHPHWKSKESIIDIDYALCEAALFFDTENFHQLYLILFKCYLKINTGFAISMVRNLLNLLLEAPTYIGVDIRQLVDELINISPPLFYLVKKAYGAVYDQYLGYPNEPQWHIKKMNSNIYYFRKYIKHGPLPKIKVPFGDHTFFCPRYIQDKANLTPEQFQTYSKFKRYCKQHLNDSEEEPLQQQQNFELENLTNESVTVSWQLPQPNFELENAAKTEQCKALLFYPPPNLPVPQGIQSPLSKANKEIINMLVSGHIHSKRAIFPFAQIPENRSSPSFATNTNKVPLIASSPKPRQVPTILSPIDPQNFEYYLFHRETKHDFIKPREEKPEALSLRSNLGVVEIPQLLTEKMRKEQIEAIYRIPPEDRYQIPNG